MHFGLTLMLSEQGPPVDFVAREVEARGFESLWVGEHTHLPVETVTRYPSAVSEAEDGRVPHFYKRCPDPYITLTAAAAATTTLRLGTCIALPAEHNPLALAKTIATLDWISRGRFEFGVGYGWNHLEMMNNGVDPKQVRATLREKNLAMKALWTQERAAYNGSIVQFTESWSWPKPVQRPHPPILLGAAASVRTFDDIAAWADGWLPVTPFVSDTLEQDLARLRERARAAQRDPDELRVTLLDPVGGMGGKHSQEAFEQRLPDVRNVARCAELGLHRFNFGAPVHDRDLMLWSFDRLAALCASVVSAGA